ncbi:GNAT family N-acetyltransferase [Ruania halotolerans]|uniref:GNAT family N-acetyltransferase n=1 Tax=Ruania halotolerans TaxID=2897773 RepID=UPI001E627970|nr:GNAT family N-acetyltransferase [Ruania halotolerans]UFU04960.1 GNAT family N-acetyltransferase [Ruania halotolerans]
MVTVRPAVRDDVRAISELRVAGWRAAYAGLVPPEMLGGLDAAREAQYRAEHWDRRTSDAELVALAEGMVVGWAVAGPARNPDWAGAGELYGLYAHPDHWSTGVGHALLVAVEGALRAAGYSRAYLLVLAGNERAAGFYGGHGWIEDGVEVSDERPGGVLIERRRVRDLTQ